MSRFPWISVVVGTVAALMPPGRDFIEGALFSSEALTRNIAQPIVVIGFGILGIVAVVEWYVRNLLYRRRQPAVAAEAPPGQNTKPTE
jgi:hypothetical protein